MNLKDNLLGGLWGVDIGDAYGLPFQFTSGEYMELNYFNPKCIQILSVLWSDDSSLTLATAAALTEGYNIERIAENFLKWYYDGEFTPKGYAFDKGLTTSRAIERIANGEHPLKAGGRDVKDNGNSSLMMILPITYYTYFNINSLEDRIKIVHEVSMITHAHPHSLIGCGIYSLIVWNILDDKDKFESYQSAITVAKDIYSKDPYVKELIHYDRILSGDIYNLERDEIRGSGYVVHTLEASLWAFLRNDSFVDAIKEVVSLGEDADTTGAVTGGLAGTYYGLNAIPKEWLEKIEAKEYVNNILQNFVGSVLKK